MQETPLGGLSLLLEHQFGGIFCFPAALTLGPALACVPGRHCDDFGEGRGVM